MSPLLAVGLIPSLLIGLIVALVTIVAVGVLAHLRRRHQLLRGRPGVGLIDREDKSLVDEPVPISPVDAALSASETAVDVEGTAEDGEEAGESSATRREVEKAMAAVQKRSGHTDVRDAAPVTSEASAPDDDTAHSAPAPAPAPGTTVRSVPKAHTGVAPAPAPGTVDDSPYDVHLPDRITDSATRLEVIRIARQVQHTGLFELMERIDTAPGPLLLGIPRSAANAAQARLHELGVATTVLRSTATAPATTDEPAAAEEVPGATDVGDEDLARLAQAARRGRKQRKTFAEYEADRRHQLAEREAQKADNQKRYRERLEHEVLFVGRGVSAGLQHRTGNTETLRRYGLPELFTAEDVAKAMGIPPKRLRWLCFHREDATCEHYHRFTIPKRSGGEREISSPKPALREAQSWVLQNILMKVAPHDAAHGFINGRSTLSNATPHVGNAVLIKLDVVDFFPSLTFPRVKGLFHKSLGFGGAAATVLALICTEPPRVTAEYDGKQFRVAVGKRQLPQGACTSPAITNIVCRRLDSRLRGMAARYGFVYTRYADDVTFSGPTGDRKVVGQIRGGATRILKSEGFDAHADKGGVHRAGRQQRVTGIVVNDKPSLDRRSVRRFRALLNDCLANGPESANRDRYPNLLGYIQGYAAYLHMVDPARAKPYREQVAQIRERWFSGNGPAGTPAT